MARKKDPEYLLAKVFFYLMNLSGCALLAYISLDALLSDHTQQTLSALYLLTLLLNIAMYEKCNLDPGVLDPSSQELRDTLTPDPALHYCEDCKVTQPLRTKHCHICGVCIYKYDHHCFWIGTCVGEYNHKYFLALSWLRIPVMFARHLFFLQVSVLIFWWISVQ